jgi:hypothetical protein
MLYFTPFNIKHEGGYFTLALVGTRLWRVENTSDETLATTFYIQSAHLDFDTETHTSKFHFLYTLIDGARYYLSEHVDDEYMYFLPDEQYFTQRARIRLCKKGISIQENYTNPQKVENKEMYIYYKHLNYEVGRFKQWRGVQLTTDDVNYYYKFQ